MGCKYKHMLFHMLFQGRRNRLALLHLPFISVINTCSVHTTINDRTNPRHRTVCYRQTKTALITSADCTLRFSESLKQMKIKNQRLVQQPLPLMRQDIAFPDFERRFVNTNEFRRSSV